MSLNQDPYLRGSGESLDSLQTQASGHRDWRDNLNWLFGNDVSSDPNRIDWSKRAIDSDGQVKVTAFDALIGRSQPEIQAAYESWRQNEVKGSAQAEDYRQTFGVVPDVKAGVGITDLQSLTTKEKDRRSSVDKLIPTLATMEGGAAVIASLGDKPTKEDVLAQISALSTKNTGAERERQDDIRAEGYTEAAAIRNHTTLEGNNQRAHEANENARLQAWKSQEEARRLNHVASENNKTRRFQAETAKYDANTKLQLGRMESADRRADRAAAREDRLASQRQQSIAALMKGLTQLGAGFAI
jgi:hypothetical protein